MLATPATLKTAQQNLHNFPPPPSLSLSLSLASAASDVWAVALSAAVTVSVSQAQTNKQTASLQNPYVLHFSK